MTDSYVDQLTLELRRRDVPGARIGEVIAEVETHLAESGDHAVETFGPPSEYAQRVSDALRPPPAEAVQPRWQRFAQLYAVGIGAFLLARSILLALDLVSPSATVTTLVAAALLPLSALVVVGRLMKPDPGPRLITWLIVAGAVAAADRCRRPSVEPYSRPVCRGRCSLGLSLLLLGLGLRGLRADRVIDPRDGRNRYPLPRRAVAFLVLTPVATLLVAIAIGLLLA